MQTVFVTGGSGFLGRTLIQELCKAGYRVRALARSAIAAEVVQKLGAEAVLGDLDNISALQKGMEGCSLVFHSAAKTEDWGRWKDFLRINVSGTENVLTAAKNAKVPRFLHVSTEAVLVGGGPIHNAEETRPLPRKKFGFYPKSKGMAEEQVLHANSAEMATMIVRPRFIWGKDDTTVLPRFIETIKKGQFAWIAGGHYPTSICHVRNVCEG
ncbi:MAG: NAD-dependent epimerase/dehydratase family protein, partial [Planctomycetota bacterium]